jgi:hypothetical protein
MRSNVMRAFAILLFALAASRPAAAGGASVADATEKQKKEAEKKLGEGSKLLEKGKLEQAVARLRESHDIVASPKATLMIAKALRNGGDLLAARAEYRQALEEAEAAVRVDDKYQATLDAIKKDLDDIDSVLGKLTIKLVHAPQGTEVTVDGEPVDTAKLGEPQLVTAGTITVLATAPDGSVSKKSVTVRAGQSTSVELAFVREKDPETFFEKSADAGEDEEPAAESGEGGSGKTLAFVAGGIGAAGLVTFGVFGLLSQSKYDDLEEACIDNHCPPDRAGDIDDGKTFQTVANVGLGVGIVGVATGVALFLFTGPKKTEAPKSSSLELGVGFRSVEVRGTF